MWSFYAIWIFVVAWNHIFVIVSSIDDDNSKSFISIFKNHRGHSSIKWSNYIYTYDEEFSSLRRKFDERGLGIKLLELGVQNGGSLHIWRKYFGPSASITGVDINPKVCKFLGPNLIQDHNIQTYCFDITDESKVEEHLPGMFDIIVDDASHRSKDVIVSFLTLFRKLNPGGVYVIEDLATSYYDDSEFEGGLWDEKSSIEFFKLMVEIINVYSIPPKYRQKFDDKIVQRIGEDNVEYLILWIKGITFEDQLLFIKKASTAREKSKTVLVGDLTLVTDIPSMITDTLSVQYSRNAEEL